MSRLLTEKIEKVIDNAKMADIVDGRFSSKPYAKEVISITLKVVGEWLDERPYCLEAHYEVLQSEVDAFNRGEIPENE